MRWTIIALLTLAAPLAAAEEPPNPVDRYFDKVWKDAGIPDRPAADDFEFYRRVSLDVIGRLPKPDEIRAFVREPDREKAIDALLASDEAAEFFADTWLRLLLSYKFEETLPQKINFPAFRSWLKDAAAKDLPYRDFVTRLLSDTGDYKQNPASNFLLAAIDPVEPPHELTNRVTRIFLGLQMQCARCHDHPFDKYTQEDFWGITAFFNGIKPKARRTFDGFGVKLMMEPPGTAMMIPDSKTEVQARFLDGRRPDPEQPPLKALAGYFVQHRQFPRAIVNRLWAHFMGRGFVEPVDRFSDRSTPSNPELLDALCEAFEKGDTRLRPLMRSILTSKAYQASCAPVKDAPADACASMALKPFNPVQVLNFLSSTLNLDVFLKEFYRKFLENKELPETYRNPEVFKMFLHQFASGLLAPTGIAPEETRYTGSVRLALKLMNSNDLQGLVRAEWGRLADILKKDPSPEGRLNEIFLTVLSRPPRPAEKERYLAYLQRKNGGKAAYEDIYWVLINSTELIFNH
ncbi:MAG TPA: DUF1549 domain-containing protein [Planctomycetota bacterium]|nr:DUF1549 domain-containing protein [Planctomycetota bacterium]